MRTFVEKLAKAIKEKGTTNKWSICVDEFLITTYKMDGNKILELINHTNNVTASIKIYDDEYDLLGKTIIDCRQRIEDVLIERLNNL